MKHLIFNESNECTGYFDEPQPGSIPYDFNPDVIWFSALKLENGNVVHLYPGLSRTEQEKKFNADKEAADFQRRKELLIPDIKIQAERKILALNWKLERAREQDELAGETSRTTEILAQRQAIRDASNALESKVLACKTDEELEKIDIKNF